MHIHVQAKAYTWHLSTCVARCVAMSNTPCNADVYESSLSCPVGKATGILYICVHMNMHNYVKYVHIHVYTYIVHVY